MSDIGTPKQSSDLDASLEAEIEAALGDISLEDMVDLPDTPRLGKAAPGMSAPASPPSAPLPPQPKQVTNRAKKLTKSAVRRPILL